MILIVHRDSSELSTLKEEMEHRGFQVVTASSADQALNAIKIESIRSVFLDLRLSDVSCKEMIDLIFEIKPDMFVYGLADYPSAMEIQTCKDKGLKGYFVKPFTIGALAKAAEQAVENDLSSNFPKILGNQDK